MFFTRSCGFWLTAKWSNLCLKLFSYTKIIFNWRCFAITQLLRVQAFFLAAKVKFFWKAFSHFLTLRRRSHALIRGFYDNVTKFVLLVKDLYKKCSWKTSCGKLNESKKKSKIKKLSDSTLKIFFVKCLIVCIWIPTQRSLHDVLYE